MKAQAGSTGRGAGRTYRKQTGDAPKSTYRKASNADRRGAAAAKKAAAKKKK